MKSRNLGYQKVFGLNVRKLREKRKWSQAQLASVSGVDETQLSRIENGVSSSNLQTILAISCALGFAPMQLFDFEYPLALNTDFSPLSVKKARIPTSYILRKMINSDFLAKPRAVSEIIQQAKKLENITLKSAPTSGALAKLVELKLIKRIEDKGKFKYQR